MRTRRTVLGLMGAACLLGTLGCTTTTTAPPPPGYYMPYCPPTGYQAGASPNAACQPSQTCAPAPANTCNTCNPCMQNWHAAGAAQ